MAKADDALSNLLREMNADRLVRVERAAAGSFIPYEKPELVLKPGRSRYESMRTFMIDAYASMESFLEQEGGHFAPELFLGPRSERQIALLFNWQSLQIDEFDIHKELLWRHFTEEYYCWSNQEIYSLLSGEKP